MCCFNIDVFDLDNGIIEVTDLSKRVKEIIFNVSNFIIMYQTMETLVMDQIR